MPEMAPLAEASNLVYNEDKSLDEEHETDILERGYVSGFQAAFTYQHTALDIGPVCAVLRVHSTYLSGASRSSSTSSP
jgi:hypothetical protein